MICGLSALFITEIVLLVAGHCHDRVTRLWVIGGWICIVVPALYAVAIVRGQPIRRPHRS